MYEDVKKQKQNKYQTNLCFQLYGLDEGMLG